VASCFLDMFLVDPTFVARCRYVRKDARNPRGEIWNCEREGCPIIFRNEDFYAFYGCFLAANLRNGPSATFSLSDRKMYSNMTSDNS
jgi:hypothetical protein